MTVATDCKIEHPTTSPSSTFYFTSTSIQSQIQRFLYEHIQSNTDDFGGNYASSGSTKTRLIITFQLSNSEDSAIKQMRDFNKLIAEESRELMRLTITGETETWKLDGLIEPLTLITKSGEPDIVTGTLTFDLINEVSFE